MSDNLRKHLYNACDPDIPATPEYYLDCSEARGSSALTQEFQRRLELKENGFLCFLFSGHIGCGKSSELAALKRTLSDSNPASPDSRYFPILLDVSEYLNDYDVELTDILIAIISELATALREDLKCELKDGYLVKRLAEIKELAFSDVEIKEGEIPLGTAKIKLQLLKKDPDARKRVRAALQPHMTTLLEEINIIFDRARLEIKRFAVPQGEKPYTDLVLIVDNLEKIRKFEGMQDELASQRELFLERYTQLTGMSTHVIYTVPLRLARSLFAPALAQRYSGEPFVLPMVKIMERGTRGRYDTGLNFLRQMLQLRAGSCPIKDVFTPAALDFLLEYSGGHTRNLMRFVQNACTYAAAFPISLDAAHRAIEQTYRTYSTTIPEEHWAKLARLELATNQKIPNGDNDYLAMLENLSVLEYINGEVSGLKFALPTPWYAVNPVVRELEQFEEAVNVLKAERAKAEGAA